MSLKSTLTSERVKSDEGVISSNGGENILKHRLFVNALEQCILNAKTETATKSSKKNSKKNLMANQWESMAEILSWDITEVKSYAYKYLVMIQEEKERRLQAKKLIISQKNIVQESPLFMSSEHTENTTLCDTSKSEPSVIDSGVSSEWKPEESLLFDTLVSKYLDPIKVPSAKHSSETNNMEEYQRKEINWEKVESSLPEKSMSQIKSRYKQILSNFKGTGSQ